MEQLLGALKISVNEKTFKKDPESSDLGKRIVQEGIQMISELGFEDFTFGKLGDRIGSNESSVYRYFQNKHMFLLYLSCWYWGWMEYQMVIYTHTIEDPKSKLSKALEVLTRPISPDMNFAHVDEVSLNKIVINEASKSYLTKEVDKENKEGYFTTYKRLCGRISKMISAINADYPFPDSLSSTVLDGINHQGFLKEHFPSMTNTREPNDIREYFEHLIFTTIQSA